ncbi:MAG: creatininase family protein, partial [Candidatus Eremiobacteraeota bacterium]|nr:creatininase family protein [Candidatus Eremiobacteraeota bacterium]
LTVIETNVLAAAVSYWAAPGVRDAAESFRESDKVGGMNHACEFETSLYLAIAPDLVEMPLAVRELSHRPSENYWTDLVAGEGPLVMMEYWSALSQTGVMGDPTKATAEKGRKLLDAAARGIVTLVDEMLSRATAPRTDHH